MNPLTTRGQCPRIGPLQEQIRNYLQLLEARGYQPTTLRPDYLLLAEFDDWLARKGHGLADLDETLTERFLQDHMRRLHSRRQAKRATLARLLAMLRKEGCIALAKVRPRSPAQQLGDAFQRYLSDERGFAPTTVAGYTTAAREFLRTTFGEGTADVTLLDAGGVVTFIQREVQAQGRASARYTIGALRSFFRFLQHRGFVCTDLAAAVPRIACWSLAGLPKHLPPGGVDTVIARCDRTTPERQRNYAIVLILARLGLRSCEVADLHLEDLDWDRGLIRVRSRKGGRWTAMPLPTEVGQALAAYLEQGRPRGACRQVFVRHRAPVGGLTPMAIRHVARSAFRQAGVTGVCLGAHTFRHTLATDLLRQGASLDEIGEVLRHKDASTTALYAKVDLTTLRPLAMRWPGGLP
ncbi:MAG TPA: site-specific integrase [Chthoniobacterales bacterium]